VTAVRSPRAVSLQPPAVRPRPASGPVDVPSAPDTVRRLTAATLAHVGHFWRLTKPKVVGAIVFTALVGVLLASAGTPPVRIAAFGCLGIWLAAASAAAFNHVLDRRLDALMTRTRFRPLPRGQLTESSAVAFAAVLAVASMLVLVVEVNVLTAALTFASLVGYSVVYTVWLKHATPQNIVIGGAAGAAPPALGWVAVTGHLDPDALALFLIIFIWTPPHFWALAIARRDEYAKAGVPMLPVTHGTAFTAKYVLLYTILLSAVAIVPYLTAMSGPVYLAGAVLLSARFVLHAIELNRNPGAVCGMRTFRFSIHYLLLLFTLLLADHYLKYR